MSDHRLAIVFRNPNPQRNPMRAKLYLLRRDGSNVHIDYPDREGFHQAEPIAPSDECGQQVNWQISCNMQNVRQDGASNVQDYTKHGPVAPLSEKFS